MQDTCAAGHGDCFLSVLQMNATQLHGKTIGHTRGRECTSIMLSMVTAVMVCAVLGIMTVAPMSSPKDCATSCVSITVDQLAKKAPADRLRAQRTKIVSSHSRMIYGERVRSFCRTCNISSPSTV